MQITRTQRKSLENLQNLRNDGPSVVSQMRRNAGVFISLLIGALVLVPIGFMVDAWIGTFTIGLFVGTLVRDIRGFRQWNRLWPVMEQVMDWKRIEELLDSSD